ncbi:MAG: DUF2752 domain-containing protein [Lachnospiraceae bacterium]|nr:DUF2752 domain-containing protein [Lachnospiraceae bacterium]
MLHAITGWYCPGCGGTRALYFFVTGHWVKSFVYHPLVLYTFIALCYITIRFIYSIISKRTYRPSPMWLWGALILLTANFIIKNILLIGFHIDLLTARLPL